MAFSDNSFIIFFLCVVLPFYVLRNLKAQNTLLIIASSFFLAYTAVSNLLVAIFAIAVSLCFFWLRDRGVKTTIILPIVIIVLVINLLYFKYREFFSQILGVDLPFFADVFWAVPLGVSFYTFQLIGALFDKRNVNTPPEVGKFSLFVLFFPQLIAGPIVKYRVLYPQFEYLKRPLFRNISTGFFTFLVGYGKKVLVADPIADVVDPVFAAPGQYSATTLSLAAIGFYVQIFADFSGYTDMGRGAARILGFRLPINFRGPYLAASPIEFWARWHITLSGWVRERVYNFLALSVFRQFRNETGRRMGLFMVIILVMTLIGLWHGAAWRFILFGLLHGVVMSIWFLVTAGRMPESKTSLVGAIVLTQLFIVLSLIVFRATTPELMTTFFSGLLTLQSGTTLDMSQFLMITGAAGLIFAIQAIEYHATRKPVMRLLIGIRQSKLAFKVLVSFFAFFFLIKLLVFDMASSGQGVPGRFIYFSF